MRRALDVRRDARRICLSTLLAAAGLLAGHAPPAHAGLWVQTTCRTSVSPTAGWTAFTAGTPSNVFADARTCPLQADVSPVSNLGDAAVLQYTPPPGSTIVLMRLNLTDVVYPPAAPTNSGWETVVGSWGSSWVAGSSSPGIFLLDNTSDGITNPHTVSEEWLNPSGAKDVFISIQCLGFGACGPEQSREASTQVNSAEMTLKTSTQPTASRFSGGLLKPHADGTVGLLFTASDPRGPGIYRVSVLIDGKPVYRATPNTNDGECVPVGHEPGGPLMFDYPQPCPSTEKVDVSVPTARFGKGRHRLRVIVTDAARDSATVLDTTITLNSTTTPAPSRGLHTQFVVAWTLVGADTLLRRVTPKRLPRQASVAVRCVGPGCPSQPLGAAPAANISRLLHRLEGLVLPPGTRLIFTVTASGRRAEHSELLIRRRRRPIGKLL